MYFKSKFNFLLITVSYVYFLTTFVTMTVIVTENETELINKLASILENNSNTSITRDGTFKVGLSGGSVVKFLNEAIPKLKTDLSKWKLFFCDERVVPEDDPESTFGTYKKNLIGKVNLKEDQFVRIKQGVSADEAAKDYVRQMAEYFPGSLLPRFDMLLLGMGPDGHTCSLFPGHQLLNENKVWVAPITDSPKPPPQRVTLTFPVINNARVAVFAIAGEGKADMVKRILVDKEDLPAGRVQPSSGELYWILDKEAARHYSK
ncbi:6-phosphogluconolactonase [Agrilus planipennis]|uniref:6-phosphogluconolactonase n=1 Tax=Agrilus planipennis TaxID=224129 RepID=A0A1W4XRF1_AGRPL|nr:6-phosphogluconolactonase [Agrilus planipennis]